MLAYTVNRLGTWFGYVALSIAVFDHTHSALAVASVLVAGQVFSALLVPALVTRIETHAARGAQSILYGFEAVATVALALLLLWHFSLPILLVLVALDGTAALAASALLRTAAARAAREWTYASFGELEVDTVSPSALASLAGPHEIGSGDERSAADATFEAQALEAERVANATLNVGFAITFTLGPALGGVIVPALGAPAALFIDAVSFLICGLLLIDLKPHVIGEEVDSVRERVGAAWQYIKQAPTLGRLLLAEGVALMFFTFSGPVEVAYAKASLHAGDGGYGLLVGVWGLGVTVGSVIFARSIGRSLRTLLSTSTLAVGLAYIGWAASPNITIACLAGLIGGIGNGVQWASLISAVQRLSPQQLHGRLMGAVESLGAICPAIGFSLGGAITVLSSPRDAFLIAGLGAVFSTFAFVSLPSAELSAPKTPLSA